MGPAEEGRSGSVDGAQAPRGCTLSIAMKALDDMLTSGGDTLDEEERAALHRSIDAGIDDFERGDTEDAFDFLARLKANHVEVPTTEKQPG